jgi:hypothetical protein
MKIHSDIITASDLMKSSPPLVLVHWMPNGSRKRHHGFTASLEWLGDKEKGRRWANQSSWDGPFGRTIACTWDEWGIWIDKLFDIDPDAVIGPYDGRAAFMEQTARWQPRGMKAPWLTATADA